MRQCPETLVRTPWASLQAIVRLTFVKSSVPRPPSAARAWYITELAPAEAPATVTLFLSPPNWQMNFWTQPRAKAWSSKPAFTTPLDFTSADERKPNAPSCHVVSLLVELQGGGGRAEITYPVLYHHSDEVVSVGIDQLRHVLPPIAVAVAAAVNVHHDGQVLGTRRRIDIQKEAILGAEDKWHAWYGGVVLRAYGAEVSCRRHVAGEIKTWEARGLPAKSVRRRCRVTDAGRVLVDDVALGIGGEEYPFQMFKPLASSVYPSYLAYLRSTVKETCCWHGV